MAEAELVFKKTHKCPVCEKEFKNLTVKQGKARPEGTDLDLKPRYKNIETLKYDVILCPTCGYAALEKYFARVSMRQIKELSAKVKESFSLTIEDKDELSFDDAVLRYKLALLSGQVKGVKESETGYLCLKFGWLYRSYLQSLEDNDKRINEFTEKRDYYLNKAYELLLFARQNEHGNIAGMDETTLDCLLAGLSLYIKKYDETKRLVGGVLTSRVATKRAKDHAREIKEALESIETEEETSEETN